jgi:Cu2+-exporting ATPase
MIADFKLRIWMILVLTIPVLLLSDTVQGFLGFKLDFTGKGYTLFGLATLIFFGLAEW